MTFGLPDSRLNNSAMRPFLSLTMNRTPMVRIRKICILKKKAPSLCPTRGPLFPKTPLKGKIHHEKLTGCYKKNYQIANKNEKGVASRMFFFREGRSRRSGGDTSLLFLGIEGQIRPSGEEKRGFYF